MLVFNLFAKVFSRPTGGRLAGALAALLAASPAAPAQVRPPDTLTTRAHRLPEAQVRAVRPSRFAVGTTQWAVDSLALSQYRTGTVADVLQARTPAYVKNYGPGQLASISLRGTAARHTAVLWNGFNINLPTLGEADFNLLPLNGLREVVVQPGPAAALYGNGAIGGTVLLDTGADFRPGPLRATVQGDLGAWGLRGSSATVQAAGGRVAVRAAASYRQAANNYPYLNPEFTGLVRRYAENAALLHQWSLSQDVALRLGAAGELTAGAWLTDADRQIQIAAGAANDHARERDQSRRLLLGYRRVLAGGGQWAVRTAWFDDVLNYTSDQVARSNSDVKTTQAQGEYTRPLGRRATLRLGAEAQHFAAGADGYGGAISENRGAAFALLRLDPRPGLRLTGNLRQALLPAGLAPLTPTVGAEWDVFSRPPLAPDSVHPAFQPLSHTLTAKANLARTYRAPTLNERYWQPGGNPGLRPENGVGGEAGLRYQRPLGRATAFTGELTAYSQTVNEWVQWLPNDRGIYTPRNLRQVRSQGLEAALGLRYGRGRYGLHGRASYALTSTQKTQGAADDPDPTGRQLAFVPLHQLALSLDQTLGAWQLGTTLGRTGLVYTDNSGTSYLPAFWPLAATAGYTLRGAGPLAFTVLVQGTNLLNSSYYTYSARPAPPRALQASLRVGWR
ncbi:TonB-dependent receptor plug domain-containing protein [Hymenobacter cheonanensis]|uniref:TonB-dependent receptor plug domain-containing protein n=1 Tax=Hymenobacter sp. CA2-7 TaxID=3063993 RepID=UPI0027129249|nr:TonB-dependent receptor [Hymenobacter sp. CA2-7]MDO7884477.1 TonB-dependent receptor [Hymenobacter sp. CA2-7]